MPSRIDLDPGERKEVLLRVNCGSGASGLFERVEVAGDFGAQGKATVSMRLIPQPFKLKASAGLAIAASDVKRWQPMVSGGSELKILTADSGAIGVSAKLGPGDRWVYPVCELRPEERAPAGTRFLQVKIALLEGKATFRAIFDEENGSGYVSELSPQPSVGQVIDAIATVDTATFGYGWSPPDENGKLDAEKIKGIKIGCNAESEVVQYEIRELKWVLPE